MSFAYAKLKEIGYVAGSSTAADIFTTTGTNDYVRLIILHNGNTTAEVVRLYCVPSASDGTFDSTTQFYKETLEPSETQMIEFPIPGLVMDTGDAIGGDTTTASKVTVQIYGGTE